jgi:hypothetical protein
MIDVNRQILHFAICFNHASVEIQVGGKGSLPV